MNEQEWLVGSKAKIARAREHKTALQEAFDRIKTGGYIQTSQNYDGINDETIYRVHLLKPLPPRIATILGDLMHNTRSALDLMVSELIRANGHSVNHLNSFVIARNESAFENAVSGRLKNVPEKAVRFFRRLKPFDGGNVLLWRLAELDNMQKHELLLPVVIGGANVRVKLRLPFLSALGVGIIVTDPETGKSTAGDTFGWMTPQGVPEMKELVDNGVFYHSRIGGSIEEEVQFVTAWALNQNARTGYLKISDLLPSILDYVERIISIAERQLRPPALPQ